MEAACNSRKFIRCPGREPTVAAITPTRHFQVSRVGIFISLVIGDKLRITVLNWSKINARKDVKEPSWFKFKHKFFEDSDFYDFTAFEKVAWLYILCECSKQNNGGDTTVNTLHAHRVAGIDTTVLKSTIKKLQSLGIVSQARLRGRYVDVTHTGARQDKIREEEIREEERREKTTPSVDDPPLICLFTIWNENRGSLPRAESLSSKRKSMATSRIKGSPNVKYWSTVVRRLAASSFCNGDNDRGWVASFDFLLKPDTHIKVMEGKYDTRAGSTKTKSRQQIMSDNNAQMLADIDEGRL